MSETKQNKQTLAEGLVTAQGAARGVSKDARNQFHKYRYASSEAVIDEGRAALQAGGLALLAQQHSITADPGCQTLVVQYRLQHSGGEHLDLVSCTPIIPDKGRPADKAVAAAKTYDLAYTLRSLLLLPRGDEFGGVDERDDSQHHPEPQPQRQAPKQRQAAPPTQAQALPPNYRARVREAANVLGQERTKEIAGEWSELIKQPLETQLGVLSALEIAAREVIDEVF